jgi:GxxExxY protein
MLHQDITQDIIGAAMAVLNELGPGLDEKIYERALSLELAARSHHVEQQRQFPVFYRHQNIGTLVPDLIIDHLVIVDTKVVSAFTETHIAKMRGYLAITKLDVALLLNFKESRLQWRRITSTQAQSNQETLADPGSLETN